MCLCGYFHISRDQLKKMLEKSKIEGGGIMQTLGDRMRKEGIEIGEKIGIEEGKIEIARTLIKRGIDMNIIAEATGFPKGKIEKLAETIH